MSHKNYTCQNCKKSFNTHEVYLWGKDKHSFCQSCNEKNKKRCSWCEKNLNCPSNLHKHQREWKWYNDNGECCHEAFCDEKCQNELQKHRGGKAEDIFEQNREELLKKGYKNCGAKLEVVGWTCTELISPHQNKCGNCQKREQEQEKRQKAEKDLAERKKEYEKKHQQVQNWWSSLSKAEKQKQIKELEKKYQKEGWHSRWFSNDKNSLEFKNGKIYYDNWSEVPPPLLEKFGINCDYSEHVSSGSMFISPNDLPTKIKDLESKLQMAKKSGNKAEIDNLEWEIQTLKDQQQKKVSKLSSSHWPWIVGIGSLFLIGVAVGFGIVAKKRRQKQNYNNGKKK